MCGRFTLTLHDYATLATTLGLDPDAELAAMYRPRYNIAPTEAHWILRERDGRRELVPARWGLVNHFATDPSAAARQINARSETVRSKPAFRDAFERRRCVVPADGFFEWSGPKGKRRPMWFHAARDPLLLFAGVYESWQDRSTGERVRTFAILTTPANALVAPVHDRMPAVLSGVDVARYLAIAPNASDRAREAFALQALLRPAPNDVLAMAPASTKVNTVGVDEPGCLVPDDPDPQLPLFAR